MWRKNGSTLSWTWTQPSAAYTHQPAPFSRSGLALRCGLLLMVLRTGVRCQASTLHPLYAVGTTACAAHALRAPTFDLVHASRSQPSRVSRCTALHCTARCHEIQLTAISQSHGRGWRASRARSLCQTLSTGLHCRGCGGQGGSSGASKVS